MHSCMSQAQETLPDTVPGFAEMEEEEQLLMKRKQELEKLEREIAVCEAQVAEETTRCYRFEEAHDAYVTQVEKTKDLKRQLALLGEKVHRATEAACTSEGCSPETQELLNQEADNLIAEQDRLLYQLKASEKAERDKHAALQQARDEATDVLKAEKTAAATLPKEDLELLNQLEKQAQIRALRSDALENAKAANEAKQEEERAKKEEEQKRLDQERAKKKEEEKMEAERLEALRKAKEREDALRKAKEEEQKKKEAERVARELEVKKKAAEAEAQALRIAAEKKAQEDQKKAAEAEALRMAAEKEEEKKKTEQAEALRKAQEEKKNMMEAKRLAHELARKKIEEELQKKAQELDALKKQQEEENQKLLDEELSGEDAALQRELLKHANIQRDLRLQEEAAKARLEKEKEKAKFRAEQDKLREEKSVFENKVSKLMESLSISREDAEGLLKLQEMQKQNNGTSPGASDGKESHQNAKRKIELEDIEARTAKAKLKLEMTREREAEMKLRSGARPLEEIEPPNMDGEGPPKMPRRLSPW